MRKPTDVLEKAGITQKPQNGTTMENMSDLENFVSHLRQFLCKPLDNRGRGNIQDLSLIRIKDMCYRISSISELSLL